MSRTIDILCAGELLVDFTTAEFAQTLDEATLFRRIPGGSPANLSMNIARLGGKSMLVATVGNDDMGTVLKNHVARLGVDVSCVAQVDDPTTLFLEMRTANGASLQTYRTADYAISIRQFPYNQFENISLFYTTCFALSRNPAQHVLLEAAEKAVRAGVQLSLNANYSEKIGPDRREAQRIVAEYCRMGAMLKISDTDYHNLYGDDKSAPEAVLDHFLKMGANEICYTLGANGCWVADDENRHHVPANHVEVRDPLGAGDAFWAGYLSAYLDGKSLEERAHAGRKLAGMKIGSFNPLPDKIDRAVLYAG